MIKYINQNRIKQFVCIPRMNKRRKRMKALLNKSSEKYTMLGMKDASFISNPLQQYGFNVVPLFSCVTLFFQGNKKKPRVIKMAQPWETCWALSPQCELRYILWLHFHLYPRLACRHFHQTHSQKKNKRGRKTETLRVCEMLSQQVILYLYIINQW